MSEYTIREARPGDAEAIIACMMPVFDERDNGTTYDSSTQFTFTVEDERDLIQTYAEEDNSLWLVAVLPDGTVVGNASCRGGRRAGYGSLMVAIAVAKAWRDKGAGTALMQRMIDWSRDNPVVYRLELEVVATNARAVHVYEKLGFEREGVRRRALKKHGKLEDSVVMAILFDRE